MWSDLCTVCNTCLKFQLQKFGEKHNYTISFIVSFFIYFKLKDELILFAEIPFLSLLGVKGLI